MAEIRINGKKLGLVNGKKVRAIHYGLKTFYPTYEEETDTIEITVTQAITPSYTLASCTGTDEEITIDWGDGDVTTYTVTTSGTVCAKPNAYATGDYAIKMPATEQYKITNASFIPSNKYSSIYIKYKTVSFKFYRINVKNFFMMQSEMTSVSLGKVSSAIGCYEFLESLFRGCSSLSNIIIPNGITRISRWAFFNCTNLTSIYIPASVTYIDTDTGSYGNNIYSLFGGCSKLTSIIVDENNTKYDSRNNCNAIIGPGFWGYADTKAIMVGCSNTIIPTDTDIKEIGEKAFFQIKLGSITIPKNITTIYQGAFMGCGNLKLHMLSETPPTLKSDVFAYSNSYYITALEEIKVPTFEAWVAYTSATNWIAYANIITTDDYGLLEISNQEIPMYSVGAKEITLAYFGDNPTFTVVSDNTSICNVSINGDVLTVTAIGEGTTNVTVTMITNDEEQFTQTFSVTVIDDTELLEISNQFLILDSTTTKDITLTYFGDSPTFTAVSDNTSICNVSVNGDIVTITAVGTGTANITVTMTSGEETFNQTFSVEVFETLPENTYTVEAIDGVTYGFTLNDSGYYESTNKGVSNSFSLCKVSIKSYGLQTMYLDCINSGESNYDFGILSNLDTTLTSSYGTDSSNVFKSFKGLSSTNVQTVDYGVIPSGEHFIYVKFRKDGSGDSGNDSLQFQVRFEL